MINLINYDGIQLAFLAGFIQADGYITKNKCIEITIQEKDKHLLEWICHTFQLNASKIKIQKRIDKRTGKLSVKARLILPVALSDLLIKNFQLSSNKSKGQVVFPSFLNDQCLKAFMLGLFYGDGSYFNGNVIYVQFMSSFGFMNQLLEYAQSNNFFSHYTSKRIKKEPTKIPNYDLASLRFSGRQAIEFFRFLAEPKIMQQIPPFDRKLL